MRLTQSEDLTVTIGDDHVATIVIDRVPDNYIELASNGKHFCVGAHRRLGAARRLDVTSRPTSWGRPGGTRVEPDLTLVSSLSTGNVAGDEEASVSESVDDQIRRRDLSGVLTLTLTRDHKLNAVSDEMVDGIHQAVIDLGGPESNRALLVTVEGRYFTAGKDIGQMGEHAASGVALRRDYRCLHEVFDEMGRLDYVRAVVAPVFASEDAREGAVAFAGKRTPNWKGC